jgi:hypothetical protein
MFDTYQMQEHICKELEKKAQSGLKSTQDLDTVWKLIDAYKNLLKIEMLQEAGEYSHDGGYEDGHSERRRKRDSMGRYSRDGYSMDEGDFRMELQELMQDAPNEQVKMKLQRLMSEM